MSSGTYVARRVNREIQRSGEIARLTRAGVGTIDPIKVKQYGASREATQGASSQKQSHLRIGTQELAAAGWDPPEPRKGDSIYLPAEARNRTIMEVDTRRHRGVTCVHIVTISG